MLLAQSRIWRVSLARGAEDVLLGILREGLPDDLGEMRDLRFEVPLSRWNRLLKHLLSDRKLVGGMLLDFASQKDLVAGVVANDRLLAELQRVVLEATAALVEAGALVLTPAGAESS